MPTVSRLVGDRRCYPPRSYIHTLNVPRVYTMDGSDMDTLNRIPTRAIVMWGYRFSMNCVRLTCVISRQQVCQLRLMSYIYVYQAVSVLIGQSLFSYSSSLYQSRWTVVSDRWTSRTIKHIARLERLRVACFQTFVWCQSRTLRCPWLPNYNDQLHYFNHEVIVKYGIPKWNKQQFRKYMIEK